MLVPPIEGKRSCEGYQHNFFMYAKIKLKSNNASKPILRLVFEVSNHSSYKK